MSNQELSLSELPNCALRYIPQFLPSEIAASLFNKLLGEVPWRADKITVFGKTYNQPRLTALYGEAGKPYSYSGITMHPNPFTPDLEDLRALVSNQSGVQFSSVLLNLYRDGQDSNGWHADNERELGPNPVIASVSLGAARYFQLKHRTLKDQRLKILLEPGSLLIMGGETQEYWLHQIAKTKQKVTPRINLTFRRIY